MGTRYDHIATLNNKAEIHAYKAQEHLAAIGPVPRVMPQRDGGQCTITSAKVVRGNLEIVCEFKKDGVVLPFLRREEVWIIVNAPMLVDDPAGDVELTEFDKHDNPTPRMCREDPAVVFDGIVQRMYGKLSA